jgi:arylsulfatase A-like enzyme
MKFNFRLYSTLLAAMVACFSEGKPNLIVIMADDLGYQDVGFNGCQDIPTPNIDRIATEGVRCSAGYTSYSVCGPSRAGFMTGRYQQRFGFERNPAYRPKDPECGLTHDEATLAEALKPAGYHSGIIGKWHLGAHENFHPLNRGFDEFFGHIGGGHRYFPEELNLRDSYKAKDEEQSYRTWIMRNHESVKTSKYLTDEFSDEAVSFIERNQNKPFFLFLSYNAPHGPLQATEEYLNRFPDIQNKKRRTYAAMVSALDDGVGRVLDQLKALDIDDNTLVFFLSDNGGPETKNASDNGPLRGAKSDPWEGGFRVPYAVRWPGKLPAGTLYDKPVSSLDIFATITELAQLPPRKQRPLDGVNLIPYLSGQNTTLPHETILLRKFDQGAYAVRHGDFKLVIPKRDTVPQLYNLEKDLGETNNIAEQHPEKLQKLDQIRLNWDAQLTEPTFIGLMMSKKNKKAEK